MCSHAFRVREPDLLPCGRQGAGLVDLFNERNLDRVDREAVCDLYPQASKWKSRTLQFHLRYVNGNRAEWALGLVVTSLHR